MEAIPFTIRDREVVEREWCLVEQRSCRCGGSGCSEAPEDLLEVEVMEAFVFRGRFTRTRGACYVRRDSCLWWKGVRSE